MDNKVYKSRSHNSLNLGAKILYVPEECFQLLQEDLPVYIL